MFDCMLLVSTQLEGMNGIHSALYINAEAKKYFVVFNTFLCSCQDTYILWSHVNSKEFSFKIERQTSC